MSNYGHIYYIFQVLLLLFLLIISVLLVSDIVLFCSLLGGVGFYCLILFGLLLVFNCLFFVCILLLLV